MLLNTYIPPRPGLLEQALATTTAIFEACSINSGDRPWLWLGDFNSDTNQIYSTAETQGGKLLYCQSTYKHHRKIDQIWTNSPAHCCEGSTVDTRISDHKILKTKINLKWKKTVRRGILHKPHMWTTPPGYSQEDWRSKIEESWCTIDQSNFITKHNNLDQLPPQQHIDTTWEAFTEFLQEVLHKAASNLDIPNDPEEHNLFTQWQKQVGRRPAKMTIPKHVWVPRNNKRDPGSMVENNQNGWLGLAE